MDKYHGSYYSTDKQCVIYVYGGKQQGTHVKAPQ